MADPGYGFTKWCKSPKEDKKVLLYGFENTFHHHPKSGCSVERKKTYGRCFLSLVFVGVLLVVLLVAAAVVVSQLDLTRQEEPDQSRHKPVPTFGKWRDNSANGLTMYPNPDDGSMVIKYDMHQSGQGGSDQYEASLEANMHAYQPVNQQGTEFTFCNKSYTPPNKVCKFDSSVLNPCDRFHHYGYSSGRPCVMLKLNLLINVTAVPFDKDSEVAKKLGNRYNPDYIGVTCDGVTEEDRKNIDVTKGHLKYVDYFPPEGFPAWWFRPRTINKLLPPIMMVRFNTLTDFKYIRIKCTAWAKNFNNGRPDRSSLYSTTFVINHI